MNAKIRKRIYYSILISLLIHFGFLVWSFFVKLLPEMHALENPQKLIHVRIAKDESLGEQLPNADDRQSEKAVEMDDPFAAAENQMPSMKSKDQVEDAVESAVHENDEPPAPSAVQEDQNLPRPQLTNEAISKKVRRATRRNLVEVGEVPFTDFSSGAPVTDAGEDISKDFLDKSSMAMKLPASPPTRAANGPDEFQVMKKSSAGLDRKSKAVDLGSTLTYELYKYQDPKTGQKYFKLLVKVRDATVNFPVIPKEIIFLVDSSESIGEDRLKQFKDGIMYALKRLNPDDRFNITFFKDKSIPLSPVSLKNDEAGMKKVGVFFDDYRAGSRTDVYSALETSINIKEQFTPSYRVVLTDGYPTQGLVNTRQVINEVSKANDGKVSIFTLGGGVAVSPYMLDFLAYKNRGWSQVINREYLIGKGVAALYDRIKDPLLLNLRYLISGVNTAEVYPKTLPDFFKGSEFVIYGIYNEENKFFLQVLGDVLGEKKEFALSSSLEQALEGDKDIARQWAFHKIYYLIGELKHNEDNKELVGQINDLCAQYGIVTPYSIERKSAKPKEVPSAAEVLPTSNVPAK